MPLVKSDEEEPEQPKQASVDKIIVERGESVWGMLSRLGGKLSKIRIPKSAQKAIGASMREIWSGSPSKKKKRAVS